MPISNNIISNTPEKPKNLSTSISNKLFQTNDRRSHHLSDNSGNVMLNSFKKNSDSTSSITDSVTISNTNNFNSILAAIKNIQSVVILSNDLFANIIIEINVINEKYNSCLNKINTLKSYKSTNTITKSKLQSINNPIENNKLSKNLLLQYQSIENYNKSLVLIQTIDPYIHFMPNKYHSIKSCNELYSNPKYFFNSWKEKQLQLINTKRIHKSTNRLSIDIRPNKNKHKNIVNNSNSNNLNNFTSPLSRLSRPRQEKPIEALDWRKRYMIDGQPTHVSIPKPSRTSFKKVSKKYSFHKDTVEDVNSDISDNSDVEENITNEDVETNIEISEISSLTNPSDISTMLTSEIVIPSYARPPPPPRKSTDEILSNEQINSYNDILVSSNITVGTRQSILISKPSFPLTPQSLDNTNNLKEDITINQMDLSNIPKGSRQSIVIPRPPPPIPNFPAHSSNSNTTEITSTHNQTFTEKESNPSQVSNIPARSRQSIMISRPSPPVQPRLSNSEPITNLSFLTNTGSRQSITISRHSPVIDVNIINTNDSSTSMTTASTYSSPTRSAILSDYNDTNSSVTTSTYSTPSKLAINEESLPTYRPPPPSNITAPEIQTKPIPPPPQKPRGSIDSIKSIDSKTYGESEALESTIEAKALDQQIKPNINPSLLLGIKTGKMLKPLDNSDLHNEAIDNANRVSFNITPTKSTNTTSPQPVQRNLNSSLLLSIQTGKTLKPPDQSINENKPMITSPSKMSILDTIKAGGTTLRKVDKKNATEDNNNSGASDNNLGLFGSDAISNILARRKFIESDSEEGSENDWEED